MKALFWDFDGTLVDSRLKNYQVTKTIISNTVGKDFDSIPFLQTFEKYKKGIAAFKNWRDIYQNGFELTAEETDEIGRLWTDYQLNDATQIPLFNGIRELLLKVDHYPNAIISQNSRQNINQVLAENKIASIFNVVIGFEEVDIRQQKPDPSGFLMAIDSLSLNNDYCIYYIGDHEADIIFANNALARLKSMQSTTTIKSIGVFYGNEQSVSDWQIQPDFVANTPDDIFQIINDKSVCF